ncbi:ethanolamine utilization protein EutJ family protein [Alkaliphilus metalliredigens QYMF]|uniref:Chaperone protein DnaK n=1 Tax=Alkaliphilus metalliredigens (strain QYMF) TaxID=293826 RepID=A6TJX8_ALKMQ|nr:ethanolamine utilization protein EutJ [Alkaliphilus metalliredigens]ABR46496.1 ethanolamine utilization protein EutJ family protein [Alkaliphilus metalliredigens QYMF]
MDFTQVNDLVSQVEKSIHETFPFDRSKELLVGVDLGTAYVVIVVLDQQNNPIACEMEFAQVVRDGLVVDYIGATQIVRKLKEKLEKRLGQSLLKAAIALPPGTGSKDSRTHNYVVEGAGLEVVSVVDEPTAANNVLQVKNGVIVDIGGGTTGLSIIKNDEVIHTVDEATGGTHLSLVLAGNYRVKFEEAEKIKKDPTRKKEVLAIVRPVIQKMASIIQNNIVDYDVETIYLVGGTCCLDGFEDVVEKETGISTQKPHNPFLVTPLGIAMNCRE